MKKFLLLLCLSFVINAGAFTLTNEYAGMKVIFTSPRGEMKIYNSLANNRWNIELSDLPPPSFLTGESQTKLLIKKKFNDPNTVMIENISADGPVESIIVNFPPGNKRASFVRNIYVNGFVNKIKITGGDLGDFEGPDGVVYINGEVKSLKILGKKYNVKNSKQTQFWGGNIWADIITTGGVKTIQAKGGSIHYDCSGGCLGKLSIQGSVNLLSADGVTVKTDRSNPMSKIIFGGGINSEIYNFDHQIKQIRAKIIADSYVKCRQIKKLTIIGQKTGKPQPITQNGQQGIINSYIRTTSVSNYNLCNISKILVKNAEIKNSLFPAKGNIKNISVNGEAAADKGNIEKSIFRAGFDGSLNYNNPPFISPQFVQTSVFAGTTLIVPFIITNDASENLTVYLRQRGAALDAVISNYNGEIYSGTNRWIFNNPPLTGAFVWTASQFAAGINSNIVLRVRDDSIPNKYSDLYLTITVETNTTMALKQDFSVIKSNNSKNRASDIIGYYEGNINEISVIGNSDSSLYAAGVQDYTPSDWENANYIGFIKNLKIKGIALSNIFLSRKKININKRNEFDFDNNSVWISGTKDK